MRCLKNKFLDFPFRGFFSTIDALHDVNDVIHFYGTDAWPFAFVPRLVSSKTVLTLDGLAWKRASYPLWVRKILKFTARFALYLPDVTVVDSRSVQDWYFKSFASLPCMFPTAPILIYQDPIKRFSKKMISKKKIMFFSSAD